MSFEHETGNVCVMNGESGEKMKDELESATSTGE